MSRHILPPAPALNADERHFFERLGSDDDTLLEPGYNQDEIFDDQFNRRASEIQRTPNGDQAVSVVPQKQGPWTGFGQLGAERPFAPDVNNRQTILKLDEWGFPERWTIMLGSTYDMPVFGSANEYKWAARALISCGSGGAIQEFYVDWMEGTTFSVVANAILINAVFNEFNSTSEAPDNLRLRATICRGACSGITLPTVTEELVATAGNPSATLVRIPPFARYVSLLNGNAAGNVFDALSLIKFYPTDTITFLTSQITGAQALAMGNRIPLPSLARALLLSNGTATTIAAKFIFHIDP